MFTCVCIILSELQRLGALEAAAKASNKGKWNKDTTKVQLCNVVSLSPGWLCCLCRDKVSKTQIFIACLTFTS